MVLWDIFWVMPSLYYGQNLKPGVLTNRKKKSFFALDKRVWKTTVSGRQVEDGTRNIWQIHHDWAPCMFTCKCLSSWSFTCMCIFMYV